MNNNDNSELQNVMLNPKIFIGMYLLHSKNNKFYLTTRIQKAYFLFCKEVFEMINKKIFNKNIQLSLFLNNDDFIPYNYGPYSKKIDLALTFYEDKNIVIVEENKESSNNVIIDNEDVINDDENWKDRSLKINKKFRSYKLNERYIDNFKESKNKISNLINNENEDRLWWEEFEKFVDRMNSNDINRILKYVYKKYPNFTNRSFIKNEVNNE